MVDEAGLAAGKRSIYCKTARRELIAAQGAAIQAAFGVACGAAGAAGDGAVDNAACGGPAR